MMGGGLLAKLMSGWDFDLSKGDPHKKNSRGKQTNCNQKRKTVLQKRRARNKMAKKSRRANRTH